MKPTFYLRWIPDSHAEQGINDKWEKEKEGKIYIGCVAPDTRPDICYGMQRDRHAENVYELYNEFVLQQWYEAENENEVGEWRCISIDNSCNNDSPCK